MANITVRLPDVLLDKLREDALTSKRSLNSYIVSVLDASSSHGERQTESIIFPDRDGERLIVTITVKRSD